MIWPFSRKPTHTAEPAAPVPPEAFAFARTIAMRCEHGIQFLDECPDGCWSRQAERDEQR